MTKVAVVGGGAGGTAAVAELVAAGHEVRFWSRAAQTLAPFKAQGGVAYDGFLGAGLGQPLRMTCDLAAAIDAAEVILVCLPTFAHRSVALALAQVGSNIPVVLDPGHTGGALEFRHTFRSLGRVSPPIAEFSTLTYVARKYTPGRVTIRQSQERAACGITRRQGCSGGRADAVSQCKDCAGRSCLRSFQREYGFACARRSARCRLGGG